METPLTVSEVADILRVHPNTIYLAIKSGRLKTFRVGEGRRPAHKIWPKDLKAFTENQEGIEPDQPAPHLEEVAP